MLWIKVASALEGFQVYVRIYIIYQIPFLPDGKLGVSLKCAVFHSRQTLASSAKLVSGNPAALWIINERINHIILDSDK